MRQIMRWKRVSRRVALPSLVAVAATLLFTPAAAQRPAISSKPDTPFKLATVEVGGKLRLGMVVGDKLKKLVSGE